MEKVHDMFITLKKHFCMEIIIIIRVITTFGPGAYPCLSNMYYFFYLKISEKNEMLTVTNS